MSANPNDPARQKSRDEMKAEMEGAALLQDLATCSRLGEEIYAGYEALPAEAQARVLASYAAMEKAIQEKKSMQQVLGIAKSILGFVTKVL